MLFFWRLKVPRENGFYEILQRLALFEIFTFNDFVVKAICKVIIIDDQYRRQKNVFL